jgi:uridine kinase
MRKRKIFGVTGPSCSFKTTICEKLDTRGIGSWLRGDHFYGHRPPPQRNGLTDYESPEAVDLPHLARVLLALAQGAEEVVIPAYDRKTHRRTGSDETFRPLPGCGLILLDSLFALNDPAYVQIDDSVVLDIADDVVWERRRERQGDAYAREYHERVMVPSLVEKRALWKRRAGEYHQLAEHETSDAVLERVLPRIQRLMR